MAKKSKKTYTLEELDDILDKYVQVYLNVTNACTDKIDDFRADGDEDEAVKVEYALIPLSTEVLRLIEQKRKKSETETKNRLTEGEYLHLDDLQEILDFLVASIQPLLLDTEMTPERRVDLLKLKLIELQQTYNI